MRSIDADNLLERTVELEAEALEQVVKYYTSGDIEEWRSWSATLAERTAFKHDIMDAPTVDAAPVVRCKDCKWRGELGCAITIVDESDKPKDDDFCSWGERKEDE